jgi:hypothetical protein
LSTTIGILVVGSSVKPPTIIRMKSSLRAAIIDIFVQPLRSLPITPSRPSLRRAKFPPTRIGDRRGSRSSRLEIILDQTLAAVNLRFAMRLRHSAPSAALSV